MNSRYDWSIDSLIEQNFYRSLNKEMSQKIRQPELKKSPCESRKVSYLTGLLRGFFK
jgi:hypothetical protein